MIEGRHKEEMKQSTTESQKKKLKQARLPFQILSPGVKEPNVTPLQQRKRKASETLLASDEKVDDIAIKENQVDPVDKKLKIANSDADKEASDGSENGGNDVEEHMDVAEIRTPEVKTLVVDTKEKLDKTKNSRKKPNTSALKRKKSTSGKLFKNRKIEKADTGTKTTESEIVAFVDLSDSPCKPDGADPDSSAVSTIPKYKDEICPDSVKNKTETQENDAEDNLVPEEKRQKKSEREESKEKLKENEEKDLKVVDGVKDEQETNNEHVSLKNVVTTKSFKADDVNSSCDVLKDVISDKEMVKAPFQSETKPDVNSLEPKSSNLENSPSEENLQTKAQTSLSGSVPTPPSPANESLNDVSSSSNSSTPATPKTPSLGKKPFKSPSSTPRRMTPKQLMKLKEKEEKKKERERLKQEKEKQKAEEQEKKMKQKQEKEEEKRREKEEKLREKEEKEKKKQAELEQKNEEKRLREEEKRLKEEQKLAEKRLKEEERKKKEEEEKKKKDEKKFKEEQKEAEKRKSAQAFASFFVKSETKPNDEDNNENPPDECIFQPFEVKNDMRLAPLLRVELSDKGKQVLDTVVEKGIGSEAQRLYLQEIRSPTYTKGSASKTWPAPDETDDDVMIIESEKPNEEMEVDCDITEKKSEKKHHRAKLLQFHENRRPPYWGTWQKKSKFIRPRAPLNQDKTMFEYDIDSDDEWEEPEDGESLRGSEDDESQDEQYEEDNDMFVPHGYLSDEEGQDELEDMSPEAMKAKLKFLQLEFEAERNEKQEKLKPRLIGCVWFCNSDSDPSAVGSHIAELFLMRRAVWEGSLPISITPSLPPTPPNSTDTNVETEESRGAKKKLVPDSMVPLIIRKVHGSRRKLTRMLVELLEEVGQEPGLRPSKRCLADKIREMAVWTHSAELSHHCWCVKEEVRKAYGIEDLTIKPSTPTPPTTPTTNITKFTKVLTSDERLKLLSTPKVLKPNTPTSVKQSTPSVKLALSKTSLSAKKRVPLVSVPPGQSIPKQNTTSLMNFVQTVAKTPTNEGIPESLSTNKTENDKELEKKNEKVKKRITPITLTTVVSKPLVPATALQEDCIVLSD